MLIKRKDGTVVLDTDMTSELEGADLRHADFRTKTLENLDLSDTNLEEADFSGADLYWLRLFRSNCEACKFNDAKLSGAVLDEANLKGADFENAYVSFDQIGVASSMLGADLRGARLNNAILLGCEYDLRTLFPSDFDPVRAGMVRIG
jgi:uncharacterized protein YjbI with pentapeptide repeats